MFYRIEIPCRTFYRILPKMYYEIKHFQVYSLQSVPDFCIRKDAHTHKFETLKGGFNTFQSVDKAFSFSHSLI